MNATTTIHASALLCGETGILIRGPSASGKSTLLLELLSDDPDGARLVADDQVVIGAANGRLLADVPSTIAGLIEVRSIGLVRLPYVAPVVIRLVVDLAPPDACPRLPEAGDAEVALAGIVLPRLVLPIGALGAIARVRARLSLSPGSA